MSKQEGQILMASADGSVGWKNIVNQNTPVNTGDVVLDAPGFYTNTGDDEFTNYTLPPANEANRGKGFVIMNAGTGNLVILQDPGAITDEIWSAGASVSSLGLGSGEVVSVQCNSLTWVVL